MSLRADYSRHVGRFALVAFSALVAVVVFAVSHANNRPRRRDAAVARVRPDKPAVYGVRVQVVDGSIGGSGCPKPRGNTSELTPEQINRWMGSCINYMMKRQRAKVKVEASGADTHVHIKSVVLPYVLRRAWGALRTHNGGRLPS
jgi:hypothetical protein